VVKQDVDCIHTLSDASALSKGALQASMAALVFWGSTKITHIVVAGGQVMASNAELMVLEMSIATALAVGCSSLVCFMNSTVAMADLVDLSPHLGQGSSLAVCLALQKWFLGDHHHVLHLWHAPSKEEWKIHQEAHKAVKAAQIPLCPSCRVLFDFVHTTKETTYWREWHKEFSDPTKHGRNFLELVGLDGKPLKPMTFKGGGMESFSGIQQQPNDCQDMLSHSWPCSNRGVLPSFPPWGTDSLLVSPPLLANKGSYFMHMPQGTAYGQP